MSSWCRYQTTVLEEASSSQLAALIYPLVVRALEKLPYRYDYVVVQSPMSSVSCIPIMHSPNAHFHVNVVENMYNLYDIR